VLFTGAAIHLQAQADQIIYNDALQNGWQDWGWATINYNNTSPVHSGAKSISVGVSASQALYVAHGVFNPSPYTALSFWINGGGSGGQLLNVLGHAGGKEQSVFNLPPLGTNVWQQFTIPFSAIGLAGRTDVDGFWIMGRTTSTQPTFYVDDVSLTVPPSFTLTAPTNGAWWVAPASISLTASVTASGHTINKVQFYSGTTLLGEDASSPYTYTWSGVGVGGYSLTARLVYDTSSYMDSAAATVVVGTNAPASVFVDGQSNAHPISPLIYGVAFASSNQLKELRAPLNRSGGNSETRYNWLLNAHAKGNDWYFETIADDSAVPGANADDHIANSKAAASDAMISIPMIGWTPKLAANRTTILPSFSAAKYGAQQYTDPWLPDAGNGVSASTGQFIVNDPNDANMPTNSAFQLAWLQHLTNRWGLSTNGGVRYYFMDNEHSIWHSTHRDVHPNGASRAEIRDKFFDYASKVKAADPNAVVLGPEEFGWSGYFNSGADLQYGSQHGWDYLPDRSTNGNMDYVCWLLNEFHKRDTNTNQRLLDYFTLHRYTEDGAVGSDDVSIATQLKRNRWTRSFWDTNYVDESWIGSQSVNKVMLIPRMKDWVAAYYPGTKIGITEYNWGAENHISGATTQADILGIYGREGLDLATRWTTPATGSPTYNAMKLYRNYDGSDSGFGDTSVSASGPNPDLLSSYAAVRSSDGALTVMVINKQAYACIPLTLNLNRFYAGTTAQVWQLNFGNSLSRIGDTDITGNVLSTTLSPQSITLFVIPSGIPPGPPSLSTAGSTPTDCNLSLTGESGARYVIQETTDFAGWVPVWTNVLSGTTTNISLGATNGARFYRAKWAPW